MNITFNISIADRIKIVEVTIPERDYLLAERSAKIAERSAEIAENLSLIHI